MAKGWARIAVASNESEAGMMRGLLEDAEIPVLVQGYGIGDSGYSSGPMSVMVPKKEHEEARQLLEDTIGLGEGTT